MINSLRFLFIWAKYWFNHRFLLCSLNLYNSLNIAKFQAELEGEHQNHIMIYYLCIWKKKQSMGIDWSKILIGQTLINGLLEVVSILTNINFWCNNNRIMANTSYYCVPWQHELGVKWMQLCNRVPRRSRM